MQQQGIGNFNYVQEPVKQEFLVNPNYSYNQGMQPAYGIPVYGNSQIPIGGPVNNPYPMPMGDQLPMNNHVNAKYAVRSLNSRQIGAIIMGIALISLGIYMCTSDWFYGKTYFSVIGFIPGSLLILWAIITYLTLRIKSNPSPESIRRAETYFTILVVLGIIAAFACIALSVLVKLLWRYSW